MEDWDDALRPITPESGRSENIIVVLDGVLIESRIDYTAAGSTLMFTSAPASDALYAIRTFTTPAPVFVAPEFMTLEDGSGVLLLEDGTSKLQLEN